MKQYSIISAAGRHYYDCRSVWHAFRLVRSMPSGFQVQLIGAAGFTRWFDRNGNEIFS